MSLARINLQKFPFLLLRSKENHTWTSQSIKYRGGDWSSEMRSLDNWVSDFVSVGHVFAFLSSHYTFLSQAWI